MFLRLGVLVVLCVAFHQTLAATDKVVCYYSSWAGYRPGLGRYTPQNINPNLCTHLIYAFLGVSPDGTIEILDPWNEIDLGGLSQVAALKARNPNLKTLISIGGWNAGHILLSGIVSSPVLRANLVASTLAFFRQWNFDGLDVAWEFPGVSERDYFVVLLQELKTAFQISGNILSVTVSADPLAAYNIPAISQIADLINLMTYDYHTGYGGVTGHNSPLDSHDQADINRSVGNWLSSGVDLSKVTISIAFYGHSYYLLTAANGIGVPAGPGISGPYTQSQGDLGYNEICYLYGGWAKIWDDVAKTHFITSGRDWISYDDELSVALKVSYAKTSGLAGVAIWSIDTDDFLGLCGTPNGLLTTINSLL